MTIKVSHECGEPVDFMNKTYWYPVKATRAQGFATLVVGLTYFGVGILFLTPTIVVGNLLDVKDDGLSLNKEEGSWFAALPFLIMPVGALLGIFIQDRLGHRYGLMLSNASALIALINLYFSTSFITLLASAPLIGLNLGFTEPAGMSYISEFSEPKVRGLFCSGTLFIASLGIFFESLISTAVNWRTSALISAVIPILSLFLLPWIPDSPIWLLSKGRKEKALKALIWFRGRVAVEDVQEEFDDLCVYVKKSLVSGEYNSQRGQTDLTEKLYQDGRVTKRVEQLSLTDLLMSIFEKRTLYPLFLLIIFQVIIFTASSFGARHYVMNLFSALKIPVDKKWAALAYGMANAAGNLSVTVLLKLTGKRMIATVAIFFAALTSIALGVYVHYKNALQDTHSLFISLTFLLNFASSHCILIPWLMLGEIFSVKNRTVACGLAGALFDVLMFLFSKTYFALDQLLGTEMFFLINGLGGIVGSFYLYRYLPETEGKSLAQIDRFFSTKQ